MRLGSENVLNEVLAKAALEKAELTGTPSMALEFPDGTIITSKTSDLLGASAALILNALKHLAGIRDKMLLLSKNIIIYTKTYGQSIKTMIHDINWAIQNIAVYRKIYMTSLITTRRF